MRIYNKVVLDIDTLSVIEEDSFEYFGEVAQCKDGTSKTTVTNEVDKEYNARMAAIAEKQQEQSDAYFEYWETTYKPYEEAQITANLELLPFEVDTQLATLEAQKATAEGILELTPYEVGYRKEWLESEIDLIPQRHAVSSEFYEQALSGINVKSRMDTAAADVAQSLSGAESAARRSAARMGLNVSSGRIADMLKTSSLDRARATGLARNVSRVNAEAENFQRLATAEQLIGLDRRAGA